MSEMSVEGSIRSYVAEIKRLSPDPGRLDAAIADSAGVKRPRSSARGYRWSTLSVGLASLLLCAAVATAATGVLSSAVDSFLGGGDPPGRHLSGDEVPSWLQPTPGFNAPDQVSVVASAGDEHLYAYRQRNYICFLYGHHVGECRSPAEWRSELEQRKLFLRGPLGESTWFGLAGSGIASIRIDYGDGPPTETAVTDGGFVLDADRDRDPQRLLGLDASGAVVAEQPLDG